MTHRRGFLYTVGLAPAAAAAAQSGSDDPPAPKSDASSDVFQAAYKGDAARVAELAKLNPAIGRLRSAEGKTALHYAAEGGQPAMIMTLSTLGADLSAGPVSPLIAAVDHPDRGAATDMSQNLLMNGSDPNARHADGRTAIELASARGYSDIVEMLVHRGATGPLADAVKTDHVYFGKRFSFDVAGRSYGPHDLDGLPQDFINEAIILSHRDVDRVKHLLKLAPALAFARATWDETAIEAASHMGLTALVRHLADQGAAVSTCTATVLGLRDRVEALIKSDAACVRERGAHDIALLAYTAIGEQRAEIADFLLRAGANLNAKALGGLLTLHIAASKGYIELAEVLVANGADVNAPTKTNATPLSMAIKSKQERMAEFLKSKGARS